MRYFIEAYRPLGGERIPGTHYGQCCLGELKQPKRAKRWRNLVNRFNAMQCGPSTVGHYRLVSENGSTVAMVGNWRKKDDAETFTKIAEISH
jgi:hypothetical protein